MWRPFLRGTVAQATKGKAPPFFKGPRGSGTVFPDDCWKGRASGTGEGSHPSCSIRHDTTTPNTIQGHLLPYFVAEVIQPGRPRAFLGDYLAGVGVGGTAIRLEGRLGDGGVGGV